MLEKLRLIGPYAAEELLDHGLVVPAPQQTYVDRSVVLDRIARGAVILPGARVVGNRTVISPNVVIGSEGPATIVNCAFGQDAEIASGYAEGAVLLNGARLGNGAHVRPATLLEEFASTAHAVGLKQSILTSFVTFGSLINACDILISGGTSKSDHSEVGSGFIHFNFTPWGKQGDKATPSMAGDVVQGVLLRSPKIFLGGLSGVVGPLEVGFGSVTVAGQVVRKHVPSNRLYGSAPRELNVDVSAFDRKSVSLEKIKQNCRYLAQLAALLTWYLNVRIPRVKQLNEADLHLELVYGQSVDAICTMIGERLNRLSSYTGITSDLLQTFSQGIISSAIDSQCPVSLSARMELSHVDWVKGLSDRDAQDLSGWLTDVYTRADATLNSAFFG